MTSTTTRPSSRRSPRPRPKASRAAERGGSTLPPATHTAARYLAEGGASPGKIDWALVAAAVAARD